MPKTSQLCCSQNLLGRMRKIVGTYASALLVYSCFLFQSLKHDFAHEVGFLKKTKKYRKAAVQALSKPTFGTKNVLQISHAHQYLHIRDLLVKLL